MKKSIIYLLLITICCSCSHTTTPDATIDSSKTEDTIVLPAQHILTRKFRKDAIIALYVMGCNDRLEMGLPDNYTDNFYGFLFAIDSLVGTPDYFERIEANIANDSCSDYLQDSLRRWLFLERMLLFPQDCDLDLFEYGVTDEMPQTHHLLDKYINRDIQGIDSLSFSQVDFYLFDIINYLMSLPGKEQVEFIIEYYSRIKDAPNLQ